MPPPPRMHYYIMPLLAILKNCSSIATIVVQNYSSVNIQASAIHLKVLKKLSVNL